ncbi:MAG: transposase [Burkholderiales bacterium]|nr:transposase [Burkholderiales bacterium]
MEYVVQWGLAHHRELGTLRAIGVDEIHIGKSRKFLTLVYQIQADCVRLLWVGKDRTKQSFEDFFTLIGQQLAASVEFVCSDMWRPYLEIIDKHCPGALNILDRFHMVAKLNKALDEVRAGEARRMIREGYEPLLEKKRWCLLKRALKRPENLTNKQRSSLRPTTSRACGPACSRRSSSCSGNTSPLPGRPSSSMPGGPGQCVHASGRSRSSPPPCARTDSF